MKITKNDLKSLDGYFRAANYLAVGQLYLEDNPLLKEPLKMEHIKKRIIGHWGTVPGQNFIYTHLNKLARDNELDMIYVCGPGHGGNAPLANVYLEGTYTEVYPDITEDEAGLKKLFKQFSFPYGTGSHATPELPGSINEGGELGYSLLHSFGAVLDNPNLIAACVIGDGEAETASLATSWHSNKFLNPKTDGAVLPILHLNGYKISNPTVLSRISEDELASMLWGMGWDPYLVKAGSIMDYHKKMALTLDKVLKEIKKIQYDARFNNKVERVRWPMIVLKTPKGWTGPKVIDNKKIEGTFRSHQVPIAIKSEDDVKLLETWLKSYKPEELFDSNGKVQKYIKDLVPYKRIGASPYANGGLLLKELNIPDINKYKVDIKTPGCIEMEDTRVLSNFIRDIIKDNPNNFRVFGPDETMSNRLSHVFETTNRTWYLTKKDTDEFINYDGRVMDAYLSENACEGWLEGYLLTGRHGVFSSYEAFIRVIDSMTSQHLKWLKMSSEISWRKDIASLNYILTSNVWQQDHNGYTHQDPGFIDHILNKKHEFVNVYLPADANTLLCVFDKVIKSKNQVNAIVASKHMKPQWLTMDEAKKHVEAGISKWNFASNDNRKVDLVMASCGVEPTMEALAAVKILREHLPKVKIRFVNVVDLLKLEELSNKEYEELFTKEKPIVFNYHGYPSLIHELTYNRKNRNIKVHGYIEEGTITTSFDMRVRNEIDRYHLVIDSIKALKLSDIPEAKELIKLMNKKLKEHTEYIKENGVDMEEISNIDWNFDINE